MAEIFVGTFKTELVDGRTFRSRFEAKLAVVEYIGWFKDVRFHSEIGDVPPSELEADYLRSPSLR
jgi:putative transposase